MGAATSRPPATFEEELDYQMENPGSYGNYGIDSRQRGWVDKAWLGEIRRRRADITRNGGYDQLAETPTDLATRDLSTGRIRRARGGSQRAALFDPDESALGGM